MKENVLNMKNTSRSLDIAGDFQLSFNDLLDGESFFNKDKDTSDSFRVRKSLLNHVDDCECFRCEKERQEESKR